MLKSKYVLQFLLISILTGNPAKTEMAAPVEAATTVLLAN